MKLDTIQTATVTKILELKNILIGLDTGLGKTRIAVTSIIKLIKNKEANKVLVIVKAANTQDPWVKEFSEEVYKDYPVLYYYGSERKHYVYTDHEKGDFIAHKLYQILLTTYDIFRNEIVLFKKVGFDCIVLDEFHNYISIGSGSNYIYKTLFNDFNESSKIILTASPFQNSDYELFYYISLLSKKSVADLQLNSEHYQELIKNHCLFIHKKDAQVTDIECSVKIVKNIMSTIQSEDYSCANQKNKDAILKKIDTTKGLPEQYSSKLLYILDVLIPEIRKRWEKLIIFTCYKDTAKKISMTLKRHNIDCVFFTGLDTKRDRSSTLEYFEKCNSFVVLVMTLKVGCEGLNLQYANNMIIFDPWWNPQKTKQGIDRINRRNQTKQVNVWRLFYPEEVSYLGYNVVKLQKSLEVYYKRNILNEEEREYVKKLGKEVKLKNKSEMDIDLMIKILEKLENCFNPLAPIKKGIIIHRNLDRIIGNKTKINN